MNSDTLAVEEDGNIYIIDDESLNDSNRYEKSMTLVHKHMNCVVALEMNAGNDLNPVKNCGPINLSNLETNQLNQYGKGQLEFTQNSVPFDFNGEYLLWMHYFP